METLFILDGSFDATDQLFAHRCIRVNPQRHELTPDQRCKVDRGAPVAYLVALEKQACSIQQSIQKVLLDSGPTPTINTTTTKASMSFRRSRCHFYKKEEEEEEVERRREKKCLFFNVKKKSDR